MGCVRRLEGIMAICPAGIASSGYYVLPSTNWASLTNTIMSDVTYGAPVTMKWLNNQFVTLVYTDGATSGAKRIWANSDPRSGAAWTGYVGPYTSGSFEQYRDIEYFNGKYVVMGTFGVKYATTLDGPWTTASFGGSSVDLGGMFIHGSTLYVYGRGSDAAGLWISTNGTGFDGPYSLGSSMYKAEGHALFSAADRVVFTGYASGAGYQYMRVFQLSTFSATEQRIVSNASGSGSNAASGIWADTTNNQLLISDGINLWQRPVLSNGYAFDTHALSSGNTSVTTYGVRSPNMSYNAGAFVNGKNVIFGASGKLQYLTPASFQNGYGSTSAVNSTNLPNNSTMLQGSARWGGVYSPTLNYWLGMDFSDASFNYSKKYNKIVYTDNPLF